MKTIRARTENEGEKKKRKKELADLIKYCRKEKKQKQYLVPT